MCAEITAEESRQHAIDAMGEDLGRFYQSIFGPLAVDASFDTEVAERVQRPFDQSAQRRGQFASEGLALPAGYLCRVTDSSGCARRFVLLQIEIRDGAHKIYRLVLTNALVDTNVWP